MADDITRQRLKKKVLERWENEGGKISIDPAGTDESRPANDHESGVDGRSASPDDSTVAPLTIRTKKRKPTQK
jgi:hypothetical protein